MRTLLSRRLTILFLGLLAAGKLHAQAAAGSDTRRSIGAYGSLDVSISRLNGSTVALPGFEMAVIFCHRWSLGLAGYGLANQDIPIRVGGRSAVDTLRFGYGGFRLGYRVAPQRPWHGGVEVLVGGGEASSRVGGPGLEDDEMFVIVPGATIEGEITSSLRVAGAASYRFVSGVDWPGVNPSAFRGFEARLGLRFGRF